VLIRVIQQSRFTDALIHANFTGHTTTSSPLPSPPTHDSLSLHHRHIQGGHLHSICHLFLGLLLLNSYEKVMEISSALYFWDQFKIVAKLTEALDTALVYLAIVAIT